MDLTYPPEAEEFRREVRAWLEANLPSWWMASEEDLPAVDRRAFSAEWIKRLREGGWICATWPKEYGGRGLSTMEAVVMTEEFTRARAPKRADFVGDTLVGPTLLQWGSEEQKLEFLPKILRGEIAWCQGFSEPNAGSDLASIATTAVPADGEWIINGQKIWTTEAHEADYCFLLARTEPDAPRHRGLSYLLVPMRQPGVTVRPIRQMDGTSEFSEVFFDDARCPANAIVGQPGDGWRVAMTTLGFERGSSDTTGHSRFQRELDMLIEQLRKAGRTDDPLVRQELARAWSTVKIMEINGLRTLSDRLHGTKQAEHVGAVGKLLWTEYHQRLINFALTALGPEAQILTGRAAEERSLPGTGRHVGDARYPISSLQAAFFFSRAETIWGGTSQVQRNLIAERALGLPKESRADREPRR